MRKRTIPLVVAALLLVLLYLIVPKEPPDGVRERHFTTFSAKPSGLRALYLALPRFGFRVALWRKPWRYLPKTRQGILLLIVEPDPLIADDRRDWQALVQFAQRGNGVWLSSRSPSLVAGRTVLGPMPNTAAANTIFPGLRSLADLRVYSRIRLVENKVPDGWLPVRKDGLVPEVPLISDSFGTVVKMVPVGSGFLVLDANPEALTNRRISEGDNAFGFLMILRSLARSQRIVWIDEWSHGFGEEPHWWWVVGPGMKAATIHLLVVGALFLLAVGIRLGPPKLVTPAPLPRGALTDALGSLLQRGDTKRDLVRWFRLQFWRRLFAIRDLFAEPDQKDWLTSLEGLPEGKRQVVQQLWAWSQAMEKKKRLTPQEILHWVQRAWEVSERSIGQDSAQVRSKG
ncbi:MAG: DUF4350 domain-containing protein [Armatimonadetes bacterium]|nr:DUF4350 domain-containing protein [Armatimonadota bacterium]MDW8121002.1 DUF4350 domain-containing protein [Armatimonadota bacterium]